jgi:hypothetical protein
MGDSRGRGEDDRVDVLSEISMTSITGDWGEGSGKRARTTGVDVLPGSVPSWC